MEESGFIAVQPSARQEPGVADVASTAVGGGAGMALLLTVNWNAVPYGDCVKVAVAVVLMLIGSLLYKRKEA
jgi:hypothetical protein